MLDILDLQWMLIPFLACLVLSLKHVYLGIHVIARKVIFVDLALAQIAALGATYALTLGYDPYGDSLVVSLFSLAFTFVGAVAFATARMRQEKVPQEAFIGIIYAAASAAAILILSKSATGGEELKHMLVGDVLLVSWPSVGNLALLYGAIGVFHVIFRKKFLAISLDIEAAEASGTNVRWWDVLFYMSFGIVITKSVAIVGVLLVFSYLVVPAVIAQMWSETIRGRLLVGWVISIVASTFGIVWSFYADYPTGPAIVVMLGLFMVISGIVYYVHYAASKFRATANVSAMVLFVFVFFSGLAYFDRESPADTSVHTDPVDFLLNELLDEEAHQLDAVVHLSDMKDPRIVPALMNLLSVAQSDQVMEVTVVALAKQQDPRAIPPLRNIAEGPYDDFLKVTISSAQLELGDTQGFNTLITILTRDEAGFARQQAIDLIELKTGRHFDYDAQKSVSENSDALQLIREWYEREGKQLKWDPETRTFLRSRDFSR